MAQFMYLVYKSYPQTGARTVNGVVSALVNSASAAKALENAALAAAAAFASAEGQSEANGPAPTFPSNYFDTAVAVSASAGIPATGNGSANGDAYVMAAPNAAPTYVDHTAYTPIA